MNYKISSDYQTPEAAPKWQIEKVLHVKPGPAFSELVRTKTADYLSHKQIAPGSIEWAANNFQQADDKLTRRLGWFTRAHPYVTNEGRMLVGLYSDGFSFSLVAFTDDLGKSWNVSEPIVGGGNIQPSFAQASNGSIVAYMRDNGPAPKRVHVSESADQGETWSMVYDHPELANPGAGLELMKLNDGRFLTIYNDTESGRHRLAVSISNDEGQSYPVTRYLENRNESEGAFHYPSIIQGKDGMLHATYSYFVPAANGKGQVKSIKYASFDTDWIESGTSESSKKERSH